MYAGTLTAWEAELTAPLADYPAQRITNPERAAADLAAEVRRRLGLVRHARQGAGR